jgi:hypothetical protein
LISRFRDKVLLPEPDYVALVRQGAQWRLMALGLRARLGDEHALLLNALQQLAVARGAKDTHHFMQTWLRAHASEPPQTWERSA